MLGPVLRWAEWLDSWLKAHLGRPYNAVLTVGLITSISASFAALGKAVQAPVSSPKTMALIAVTVLFQIMLLINQLAQLHRFREERREARAARKAKKAAAAR